MRIKLDSSGYSSHFHDVIHSWDRYIIAYGGRGSSKTDSFYLKYILSLFEPYYFRLAYINKEGSNIRDQQYAGFKRVAKRIGVDHLLKFYDGDYRIINPSNGNALIPKGMDDPEKTKGMDDVTAIWWDEINKGDIEDFRALNDLLRSPMAKYLQFAMSFNPVYEKHWLRETFFHPDNPHTLHPDYEGKALLNRSTYKNNEFINQAEYYETLLLSAAGNENTVKVNIEGEWGLDENGNPWLYTFDKSKHVKDVRFIPSFPVYISFDFNNSPFEATAWQFSANMGGRDSFIHCVKEFSGEMKIEDMCDRINAAFPNSILFVTGDRSGQNEDIGRNQTLYQMIASKLRLGKNQVNLNSFNLEHADSRTLMNVMFANYPNVFIDTKCTSYIRQCEIAKVDEKSKKPHQLYKDRGVYKMDGFDSGRYFFQTYFLDYAKKKYLRFKYTHNDTRRDSFSA